MATQIISTSKVTWTDIVRPTPMDVKELEERYPFFHPLHLEDMGSGIERPKIDDDEVYLFIIMHFPLWDAKSAISRASEVDFFVGRGYLVTIHDGTLKPLVQLVERCVNDEEAREMFLSRGTNQALHRIIDMLVDYIFPILRQVDRKVRTIEEGLFDSDARKIIRDISLVRRDVLSLRRIIRHQIPIVEELEGVEHPLIHEDLEEYFGDIADHLYKARDIIEENAELIASFADTADTLASHRINEVMRILTVFSVIMLPLTLITSFYGMNTQEDLPFADHPNAFIILTGIMIIMTVAMLYYFRRRGWL